jgi:hypothetical protein
MKRRPSVPKRCACPTVARNDSDGAARGFDATHPAASIGDEEITVRVDCDPSGTILRPEPDRHRRRIQDPFPATVVMKPAAEMRRTRWLVTSVTNTLSAASTASAIGLASLAWMAGPPSPLNPSVPLPARVVIPPVAMSTRRTRSFLVSAMSR